MLAAIQCSARGIPWSGPKAAVQSTPCYLRSLSHPLILQALATCVRCHLLAISTQLHAAPASRSLLADIVEVQHALVALSNTCAIGTGEQHGRATRQWSEQVFGLPRLEILFSTSSTCL